MTQVLLFPGWHLGSFSLDSDFSEGGSVVAAWMQGTRKHSKEKKQYLYEYSLAAWAFPLSHINVVPQGSVPS